MNCKIDYSYASPNCNGRKLPVTAVNCLIFHYTVTDFKETINIFLDEKSQVSAHYVIDRKGKIFSLVDETKRAWHAGAGFWRGNIDINSSSIGIEIVNPGPCNGYESIFPLEQMQSVIWLSKNISKRWLIPKYNMIGHSDLAVDRKIDPGINFNWSLLAQYGIGIWPGSYFDTPEEDNYPRLIKSCLGYIGYDISDMKKAIKAFQLHYRAKKITGEVDTETMSIAWNLVKQIANIEKRRHIEWNHRAVCL